VCLILLALDAHPRYRLIVAANRDELHERPSEPAHFWPDRPAILAGRDRQAGGTWMGVSRSGRFAAVTNFREPAEPAPGLRSRGELCAGFLARAAAARDSAEAIAARGEQYGGFSLILRDAAGCWFVSNRNGGPAAVAPGVHGLSNHTLNEPWPKVRRGRRALAEAIATEHLDPERLLAILADTSPAAGEELPDTGLAPALERRLSAIFIRGEQYGTRSSTVLLLGAGGQVQYVERSFDAQGNCTGRVREQFAITGSIA